MDLQTIKGIGPKRLEWLHEIAITSVPELAALSADELTARLAAHNRTVPRELLEACIAQAQNKTALDIAAPPDEWVSRAVFDIAFEEKHAEDSPPQQQTRVVLRGTGESKIWGGWPVDEMQEWIASHLSAMSLQDEPPLEHYPVLVDEIPPTAALRVDEQPLMGDLQIVQVQIFQPVEARMPYISGAPERLMARPLRAHEPFTVKTVFESSGLNVLPRYNAQFFTRDLDTGQKLLLGQTQSLQVDTQHTFMLAGVSLRSGSYRIQINVTLENAAGSVYLELPLLRVA